MSPLIAIVAVALTLAIIAIIFAFFALYVFRKCAKEDAPKYNIITATLISGTFSGIIATYLVDVKDAIWEMKVPFPFSLLEIALFFGSLLFFCSIAMLVLWPFYPTEEKDSKFTKNKKRKLTVNPKTNFTEILRSSKSRLSGFKLSKEKYFWIAVITLIGYLTIQVTADFPETTNKFHPNPINIRDVSIGIDCVSDTRVITESSELSCGATAISYNSEYPRIYLTIMAYDVDDTDRNWICLANIYNVTNRSNLNVPCDPITGPFRPESAGIYKFRIFNAKYFSSEGEWNAYEPPGDYYEKNVYKGRVTVLSTNEARNIQIAKMSLIVALISALTAFVFEFRRFLRE